jgi:hypothetical protein
MCQDKSPLIDNLIYVLDKEDKISITKEKIKQQEAYILRLFGFDLNFTDPISFIDRYMRLLDQEMNHKLKEMSILISILFQQSSISLDFRPS